MISIIFPSVKKKSGAMAWVMGGRLERKKEKEILKGNEDENKDEDCYIRTNLILSNIFYCFARLDLYKPLGLTASLLVRLNTLRRRVRHQ